ncbi:MAG: DMT family transporter, partial [Bacteroidota bacterium]|nr:DMT family transporter [Bacteroidota bacterium]
MKTEQFRIYAAIILAMIFWSLSFVWYKEIYQFLKPITVIFLRLIISSVILLIATSLMGRLQKIEKKDIKLIMVLAFFEPFLYFVGESFGMSYVSPVLGSVIIS